MSLEAWNQLDLAGLLELERVGRGCWRSRLGDANMNGRSYGGQLLGQAMAAALQEVPQERPATMMQFLFLQGAMPHEAIDFQVTTLQEGKRFSARHVRASQANGRTVLDAHVTCAAEIDAPFHGEPTSAPESERPEDLQTPQEMDPTLLHTLEPLGGYARDPKPSIHFRIPEPSRQFALHAMSGSFRFWLRASRPLPTDPRVHAAAFAYLSDWWLNFSSLGLHLSGLEGRGMYIASLNHAIWLHRPPRADQWLHVRTSSPGSAGGRGLSIAAVHDLRGHHIATLTQECLMAYADQV